MNKEIILSMKNLKKYYLDKNFLGAVKKSIRAVDGIEFNVYKGETIGIVGESGSGKSTLGKLMLGIEKPTEGSIIFKGSDREIIYQNPDSAMNPLWDIEKIVSEPLYNKVLYKNFKREKVVDLLEKVGLKESDLLKYPHEFSGGQKQRICIARALASQPDFIVCDEPIASLDISIQAQIVNLLQDIQEDLRVTYVFITHDLTVVRYISDRIAVMYLGKIVEIANKDNFYENPLHPYTKLLLNAIPTINSKKRENEINYGNIDNKYNDKGCKFYYRCKYAMEECLNSKPILKEVERDHKIACHLF